jgi:threonylcarbamoyladenosine tRNA methylthiotransferase MtaB
MATFFIRNFGCRATQADAAAIRQDFLAKGYRPAESDAAATVIVLNTCTVTAAADAEARESIRRIHRENPTARIIATGCYAQRAPEELAVLPGVTLVAGNSHQHALGEFLATSANFVSVTELAASIRAPLVLRDEMLGQIAPIAFPYHFTYASADHCDDVREDVRTRPTLKIQDGCNHRCAYCVIPLVRGRSRSIEPALVVEEISRLVGEGAQEIVLSGIDLGSYGRDLRPRSSLHSLVRKIITETPLASLRLSSIEPIDVTQDFIELVASEPRIAPHFHMPLQSGSDKILRAMHRWYRAAHYARRVEMSREALPHAAIGADVIAGFPGETSEDHLATLNFLSALPLSYLHVFSFSPRPSTEAAGLPDAVPERIIHARARALRAIGQKKSQEFRASQAGRRVRVLTLDRQREGGTSAITGNYLNVRVAGLWPRNRWLEVALPANDLPAAPITS